MKRSYKLILTLMIAICLICAVPTTASAKQSRNSYAKKITATGGKLTPSFIKTRKTYSVTVPATTTKVTIKATKAHSGAKIYIKEGGKSYQVRSTYTVKLKAGQTKYVYIKIKAQNRKYIRVYRVKVTRRSTQTAPVQTGTVSQRNAVGQAKSYLSIFPLSRDGLIDQLLYEKFSYADAVYGADNSGANWNDQAVKSARSYMELYYFSREGLIDQLLYEKFTLEQAQYGAASVGLY